MKVILFGPIVRVAAESDAAPLTELARRGEQPVHGALGRQVSFLVEQRGRHGSRRSVDEPFGMQDLEHGLPLLTRQGPRRLWLRRWDGVPKPRSRRRRRQAPIVSGTRWGPCSSEHHIHPVNVMLDYEAHRCPPQPRSTVCDQARDSDGRMRTWRDGDKRTLRALDFGRARWWFGGHGRPTQAGPLMCSSSTSSETSMTCSLLAAGFGITPCDSPRRVGRTTSSARPRGHAPEPVGDQEQQTETRDEYDPENGAVRPRTFHARAITPKSGTVTIRTVATLAEASTLTPIYGFSS